MTEGYRITPDDAVVELFFSRSTAINVPVEIAISEDKDEDTNLPNGRYLLTASLYKERANSIEIEQNSVAISCPNLDSLRDVVRERVIPLYIDALSRLQSIAAGDTEEFPNQLTPVPDDSG